jgi:hypothetical protein
MKTSLISQVFIFFFCILCACGTYQSYFNAPRVQAIVHFYGKKKIEQLRTAVKMNHGQTKKKPIVLSPQKDFDD